MEYDIKDSIYGAGYSQALKEIRHKKIVVVEHQVYALTEYQYRKAMEIRANWLTDEDAHSRALDYIIKTGHFICQADSIFNY